MVKEEYVGEDGKTYERGFCDVCKRKVYDTAGEWYGYVEEIETGKFYCEGCYGNR